ncbi:YrrS family protein [Alkalihalobacillus sp. CinArs1]|uniref:YrrS family protein n=1 Tax=Alkalihalobacillus sp. CinArs1 TaxID=2995314 RepID=UPI0022DD26B4|nr:YrrS family protein [Alkalihalobacillus sp. CinArs1]
MKSRYNARHSKRKQNIILNSLIGIVGVVILILIVNIFFNGDNTEPTAGEETASTEATQSESNNSNTEDAVTSDEASDSATDEETNDDASNEETKNEEESQDDKEQNDENASEEEEASNESGEVNLEGPWQPVGTSQDSSNHVSSYDKGSVDWNEKLDAVETVVGFPKEEMVVHWLGGNGGPQKSEATVSQKGGDGTQYVVELEWVDEKGWKPVSAKVK